MNRKLTTLYFISFLTLGFFQSNCGIPKQTIYFTKNVITNKYFQTALFCYSQIKDAEADAVQTCDFPYGVKKNEWHKIKNQGKFALITSQIIEGYRVGTGKVTIEQSIKDFAYKGLIALTLWHWRFRYVKYNNAFETSERANQHIIYIPNITKDNYIGLENEEVLLFDFTTLFVGLYGLFTGENCLKYLDIRKLL